MKRTRLLTLAAMLLVPIWACDEGDPIVEAPAQGTVQGTVTVDGTGVSGVTVTLSTGQTATTGSGGTYSIANVTEGVHTATISGFPADATFPGTSKAFAITTDGQSVVVDFAGSFVRTASIFGAVTSGGSGVGGVTVQVTGPESRTTATSSTGQYNVTGLRAGTYTVTISGAPASVNCTTTTQQVTVSAGQSGQANFSCAPAATSTVTGVVTLDGQGAAGVSVELSGGGLTAPRTATTDANGRYSFANLTVGAYSVSIVGGFPNDATFSSTSKAAVVANAGSTVVVDFSGTITRTARITGTVTDGTNAIAGVTVTLSGAASATTTTNSSGQYNFGSLRAGDYTVTISGAPANVQFPETSRSVNLTTGEVEIVNFVGARTDQGSISGTVSVGGSPLSGITVTLGGAASRTATTGSAGTYSFGGLAAGDYTVTISGIPDTVNFATTTQNVGLAQNQAASANFSGTRTNTGALNVTVTAAGQNQAGVTVTATGPESRSGQTGSNGQVSFSNLRPGTYTVTIGGFSSSVQFDSTTKSATVATGQTTTVTFAGTAVMTSSIGGVVTLDGAAAPGIEMTLTSGSMMWMDTTDAQGRYSFGMLAVGSYTVAITGGAPADASFTSTSQAVQVTAPGQNLTADFSGTVARNATIAGNVTSSGAALGGVIVTLSGGASAVDTTAASNGRYSFAGLRAGTYTVTISNFPATTTFPTTDSTVTVAQSQSLEVDFQGTTQATGMVMGNLFLDANGDGMFTPAVDDSLKAANIQVTLQGPGVGQTQSTNTNANGVFTFSNLATGNYVVTLASTDPDLPGNVAFTGTATQAISVVTGQTTTVNYPFQVTGQTVRAFAFLGRDNGTLRGPGVTGAQICLYQTQAAAATAGTCAATAGRIGTPVTTTNGTASFNFARSADAGPGGSTTDRVVFALITPNTPSADMQIDPGSETIIEISYGVLDSLVSAADTFDLLNTRLTMRFTGVSTDADAQIENNTVLAGWNAGLWRNDTTIATIQETMTNASGAARFVETTGAAALPDTFFLRLAGPGAQPTDANFFQDPVAQGAATGVNRYLRVVHNGIQLPGDSLLGFEVVTFTQADLTFRVHHEQDDSASMALLSSGDAFDNVENVFVRVERTDNNTVVAGGPLGDAAAVGSGFVQFNNVTIHSGRGGAAIPLRAIARSNVGTQLVVEEDTLLLSSQPMGGGIAGQTFTSATLLGSHDSVAVCPLGGPSTPTTATAAGRCSTFAHKYNNGTIQGVVRTPGGLDANGVRVRIRPGPNNYIDFDEPSDGVRATPDTTVRVTGGSYIVTGLTEGQWIVEAMDTITAGGDTIFTITGQRADTVDVQGSGDNDIANFTAASDETEIRGVVVNDRDADANTIDPGEAAEGVTINLYKDNSGVPTVSADSLVATTTTNASGAYTFADLREGTYVVQAVSPAPNGGTVLTGYTAAGAVIDTQHVSTATTAVTGVTNIIGSTSPNPLPRWDYGQSQANNANPSHFTFLFANGTARATVTTGAGAAVAGMTMTLRRCDDSPGFAEPASPPAAGTCQTYMAGFTPQNQTTDATGTVNFTSLLEGVYEITSNPTTAGFTSTTPASRLYVIKGSNDVEVGTYTANP